MWGGKINVAHAFCNIPLASLFASHLAFRVSDYYYFELCLPFGFTWSPFVWNSFSDFIQRYCALQGVNCVVYCDDFLVLAPNKNDCFWDMSFYAALGISINILRLECPLLYLFRQGLRCLAPPSRGPKKGLTLLMLCKFRRTLDISDCHNLALWAAIVVGFFSFLRASNLVPRGARDFEGVLFLQRSNIKFTDEGAVLKVRCLKTNQFGDQKVRIPIP
jgi:hypothetical protein